MQIKKKGLARVRQSTWPLALIVLLASLSALVFVARGRISSPDASRPYQLISRASLSISPDAWNPEELGRYAFYPGKERAAADPSWRSTAPGGPDIPEWEEEGDGPRLRQNFFLAQRAYPRKTLPQGALLEAWEKARAASRLYRAAAAPTWENIGPAPMKDSHIGAQKVKVSGRVTALAIDPRNSKVVYLGTAMGGVWKTTNAGNSWTPLTDHMPSLAIGAIALAPSNPDIVYVGTGEPSPGLDNYYGVGIYKSTDGGKTWTHLGKDLFTGLGISAIAVHPHNPNVVYVATTRTGVTGPTLPVRGIFVSRDGGKSWTGLLGCRDCWGASDLLMNPKNPNVLYAAFWSIGIFKSTDGGTNWTQLTRGLPGKDFGRIELAMALSNPNVLYAGYEYRIPGKFQGGIVFKSTDGGASWTWLDKAPNYCTGQCWYDNVIAVHPRKPNHVILGGSANYVWQPVFRVKEVVVRSTDGGNSWEDLSPNDAPARTLHPDVHAIAFDPQNPNIIWVGNDGGVWRSTDGGRTWQNRNTNLSTLQFTGIGVHPTNPDILFGGMQDNNKARTTGGKTWQALDVGDGGYAAIDPFNPTYYYGSRFGISFQRNDKGGSAPIDDWPMKIEGIDQNDRALFYAPFALDPSTPKVIYYGTHRLYRSTDRGEHWTPISGDLTKGADTRGRISAIAVAPSDSKTIYVGTSDGRVQVTTNIGQTWTDITRPPLPNRWVSRIAVSPNDARVAYVVFNGFNTHTPDAPGHVFKTTDRGRTWRDISGNLPDVPVLSIVLDPDAPGTIYIGTDVGVFRSTDDGRHWTLFGKGMPPVPVVDLYLHRQGKLLFAATHGRSVYRISVGTAGPTPTHTPTAGPTPTPTPTWTATPTPPAFTPKGFVYLPAMWKTHRQALTTPTPTPAGTLLPTATPSPTPTPTPTFTPTPAGPTPTPTPPPSPRVYYDDFSNPNSGWGTGAAGACQFAYTGGVYGIAVTQFNQVCYSLAPNVHQVNGVFEVRAAKSDANDGSVYGLIFGANSMTNLTQFYVFWVDPYDQTYILQKYNDGAWTNLTDVGTSAAISMDDNVNVLKVRRQGEQITLYVNGVDLVTVRDGSFADNGYVGLAAWAVYSASNSVALFDDFKVTVPTVVLQDDFSNPATSWPTGSTDVCQAAYANGEYATVTQPNWACVFRAPIGPYPDGSFQVTARREAGTYPIAYGLVFGEDGSFGSLYAFLVVPDTQEYALAVYDGGWTGLTYDPQDGDVWVSSAAIHAGTEPNVIKVVRDATKIHLFVNDQYLETIQDAQLLYQGYVGLINWPSSYAPGTVYFDDYRAVVWDEPIFASALRSAAAAELAVPLRRRMPTRERWSGQAVERSPRRWGVPGRLEGLQPQSR